MAATSVLIFMAMASGALAGTKNSITVKNYELTYYDGGDDNVNFCEATHACVTMNSKLVKVDEKEIEDAVELMMSYWGYRETWIGGTDMYNEGYWKWIDNTELLSGYQNWAWGEPNNADNEDCLNIQTPDGVWHDHPCHLYKGFICQKDAENIAAADYTEYELSKSPATFLQAKQICNDIGARLVIIKNKYTFEKLQRIFDRKSEIKYWIGAAYDRNDNEWKWEDEEPLHFQNWRSEMSLAGSTNQCAVMTYNGWATYDCDSKDVHYMCEAVRPHNLKLSQQKAFFRESETLVVFCSASGFPLPDVTWYKKDVLVSKQYENRVHQVIAASNAKLIISNALLDDAGIYRCFATSIFNSTKRMTEGFVNVKVYPPGVELPTNEKVNGDGIRSVRNSAHRIRSARTDGDIATTGNLEEDSFRSDQCSNSWMLPVIITLSCVVILLLTILIFKSCFSAPKKPQKTEFVNAVFSVEKN